MKRLDGRVALVTGAAGAISRATAERLASEGASVLVTDIAEEGIAETVRAIADAGGWAEPARHDVTSEQDWEAATARAAEVFGGLEILVNNAGVASLGIIEETALEAWERVIAIDQTSVFLGMKVAAEHLKRSSHASVVDISSIFGTSGGFGRSPAYHAAKGAVRTLTKNAAVLWATEGIRVNSVHPGFIDTVILDPVRGTPYWDAMLGVTPMGQLGHPDEVAAGVAYLASDDATFVTGLELYIDGGYTAR